MAKRKQKPAQEQPREQEPIDSSDPRVRPNWKGHCSNCGESPIVPLTGMCGPCTFGESETAGGNW